MSDPFFLGVQIITLTENVITGTVYQSLIYCFGVSGPLSVIKCSVFYVYLCACIIILCAILLVSFMQS